MTYRAIVGLSYPADADSLAIIRHAGGFTNLIRDDPNGFTQVRMRYIEAHELCDDVPEDSVAWLLAQGLIECVHTE